MSAIPVSPHVTIHVRYKSVKEMRTFFSLMPSEHHIYRMGSPDELFMDCHPDDVVDMIKYLRDSGLDASIYRRLI